MSNDLENDLSSQFSANLNLNDQKDQDEKDKEEKKSKLESLNIKSFAEYMKSCKNIIFMNGAGISTAAGIPDFRSPKTGLYENLEKYNLSDPHLIFSLDFFKTNPQPFFSLSKELMPKNYRPTISHYFQKLLVDKNMVRKIYTQNIDDLESIANIPIDKIVHAHGSFRTGHCLSCNTEYSFEWMKKFIHEKEFLKCENKECLSNDGVLDELKIVKPDITFFGERLPEVFFEFKKDFDVCDCLIVIGTSLKVYPFAMLVDEVSADCPRLLINRDLVGDWESYQYYPELNKRDVSILGDCDKMCMRLADLLGFKKELEELIKKENENV